MSPLKQTLWTKRILWQLTLKLRSVSNRQTKTKARRKNASGMARLKKNGEREKKQSGQRKTEREAGGTAGVDQIHGEAEVEVGHPLERTVRVSSRNHPSGMAKVGLNRMVDEPTAHRLEIGTMRLLHLEMLLEALTQLVPPSRQRLTQIGERLELRPIKSMIEGTTKGCETRKAIAEEGKQIG